LQRFGCAQEAYVIEKVSAGPSDDILEIQISLVEVSRPSDPEFLQLLFEPFSRVDENVQEFGHRGEEVRQIPEIFGHAGVWPKPGGHLQIGSGSGFSYEPRQEVRPKNTLPRRDRFWLDDSAVHERQRHLLLVVGRASETIFYQLFEIFPSFLAT
jgi:hypothetical protein